MSISAINHGNSPLHAYRNPEEQSSSTNPDDPPDNPDGAQQTTSTANRANVPQRSRPEQRKIGGTPATADSAPRVRRQPGDSNGMHLTSDDYAGTAIESELLGDNELSTAAGEPGVLQDQCAGLATTAMQRVASRQSPDLAHAVRDLRDQLTDPATRQQSIEQIRHMHQQNRTTTTTSMPGLTQRDGEADLSDGHDLADELQSQFETRHITNDGTGDEENTFAEVTFSFANPVDDHVITIHRLHPSNDYRNDQYEIYDPNLGVFRYNSFQQMAAALVRLYDNGYRNLGGITNARTTYYADASTYHSYAPVAAGSRPRSLNTVPLGNFGSPRPGHGLTPPDAQLPPPPDFSQPGPSGGRHTDLRRSVRDPSVRDPSVRNSFASRQPFALYRPSSIPPEEVKKQFGFDAGNTPLGNVNLEMHDYHVRYGKGNVDGAGYLGTFRDEDTATQKLASGNQKDGYVYYVAPTPNMVDVNGSLGNWAAGPNDREVAAMGNIQYTQIRGWRKVHDGKIGPYEANPDYRWDVYDKTQTAGARRELAGFSAENRTWGDTQHNPFASKMKRNGRTFYKPNEDPALTTARFIQHANAQVQNVVDQQSLRMDYTGPVHIKPYWRNNRGEGSTRLNFYSVGNGGYPSVDSSTGAASEDELRFGPDGRIHLARDYTKVLRIDSYGNAYIGDIPKDKNDLNGVFEYSSSAGTLEHLEDHKYLTEGKSAYTPFVSDLVPNGRSPIDRQRWSIQNMQGRMATPTTPLAAYNQKSTAGSPATLREFEHNPDSALPRQATHFVTTVPGTITNPDNKFLDYVAHIKPGEATRVNDWLRSHNAAWIFRDGFAAVSISKNTLEVRTIGGRPVWHVHIDPVTRKETYELLQNGIASNYWIRDPVWRQIKKIETSDGELESREQ
ncbi:heat-labile enterotoxin A chain [Paraburkholderia sp. Tr-20389]|uniref:enterotoxin A family protein n=1 Tax=Paraburkholderia sp. Tr-20389 TaxID=2703903 RepID=UPI00197D9364|nr:enterotoxin A family protein [Paraburkholderia sp. Tr-20389]MBN3752052.1 heat-labile enterotoxin A chain [Paraburkholderia sp. Tr-20389]